MLSESDMEALVGIVERAGREILRIYEDPKLADCVQAKPDDSPLTAADLASHRVIVEALEAHFPGVAIFSEEGDAQDIIPPNTENAWWLVDPLDGTKEFIRRTGEFTVNIGLVQAGRPLAGIVHAPALGRSWIGRPGHAESIESNGRRSIRVRATPADELAVAASRDHAGAGVRRLLESAGVSRVHTMGSSIKFCMIAEGKVDLYLRDGPTMEWDTAAAHAVLHAAGGRVLDISGDDLRYGKPDLKNPEFLAIGDPGLPWRTILGTPAAQA